MGGRGSVLVAGAGYVGLALAERLVARGYAVTVLRRSPVEVAGATTRLADLRQPSTLTELPRELVGVVFTAGPDASDPESYRATYVDGVRHLLGALATQGQAPRVLFTSSTAVYAQRAGEWVDETSPTETTHFTGQLLLAAEALLAASGLETVALRLGGLYGPGRSSLVTRVQRGEPVLLPGPPRYTNRIHRDDAAGALLHLLEHPQPPPVVLGVDTEPTDRNVVVRWLAERLGVQVPEGEAPRGPRGESNKRCRNTRLLGTGFSLRFPSFREGYGALLESHDG